MSNRIIFSLPILALLFAAFAGELSAGTVTNLNDSGPGSLRDAALSTSVAGKIDFALTGCPCTITLTSGDLAITRDLTIVGPGADQLTISGNNAWRPFRIGSPYSLDGPPPPKITVDISGLRITNGLAGPWPSFSGLDAYGGAILAVDTYLTVRNCTISGNLSGRAGGGIAIVIGSLSVINSAITGNSVYGSGQGGGIVNLEAELTILGSTMSANQAVLGGGIYSDWYTKNRVVKSTLAENNAMRGSAVYIVNHSTASLEDSTMEANSGGGGVIENNYSVTSITNSTISGNEGYPIVNFNSVDDYDEYQDAIVTVISSTIYGNWRGVYTEYFRTEPVKTITRFQNSIVAGSRDGPDLVSPYDPGHLSLGHNIIGNAGAERAFVEKGDQVGKLGSQLDPGLMPLAFNGGATRTHALRPASAAVDAGIGTGLPFDQRGFPRVVDNPHVPNVTGGDGTDIGAFESQSEASPYAVIAGRVRGPDGVGLGNILVKLMSPDGTSRSVLSARDGSYRFDNVPVSASYTVTAASRRYRFAPHLVQVDSDVLVDLVGQDQLTP